MVTNSKGVASITSHADCAPIYIYDPVNEAIGLSHAGWRGITLEIARRTVEKMKGRVRFKPRRFIRCNWSAHFNEILECV